MKHPSRSARRGVVVVCLLLVTDLSVAADAVILEVDAGSCDRVDVPVSCPLPAGLRGGSTRDLRLTRVADGRAVAVQVERAAPPHIWWIIESSLPAGHRRRYRLSRSAEVEDVPPDVAVRDDGKKVTIFLGDRPVLVYHEAVVPAPDPAAPWYGRSGHIHPLFNPSGQAITDDFAPDHPHQHGVMFAWTDCTFEGRPVNFWDQKKQQARVEHVRLLEHSSGAVFGSFCAHLRHTDLTAPGAPKVVLDEICAVRAYRTEGSFLIDLKSTQRCAGQSPLVINQYHYGGMAIRGHRDWRLKEGGTGDFITSQGKTRADGNHSRPRWCDINGPVDGTPTGVTILCHPSNFRFPQPVRLHPSMPYFCFAPMVLEGFSIDPGTPYVSRYRLFIHDGEIDPEIADRLWKDWAEPASVRVVADG